MKKIVLSMVLGYLIFLLGCEGKNAASKSAVEDRSKEVGTSTPKFEFENDEARNKAEYIIKLAYTDPGEWPNTGSRPLPEHAFALMFKSVAENRSNGRIYVELFPGNTMGNSKDITEMVKSGSLEMASTSGTAAGIYPEIQVFGLPYAFISDEVSWDFFDNSDFWKEMKKDFEEKTGMVVVGLGQNGMRHFTNSKKPIRTPKDMEGMKFRVMQSPIYVKTVEALGATAVPLAHSEIYTACQTGVVDGQENPSWNIYANRWYEVQDYMTLDGHTWSENLVIMNGEFFYSLPKDLQRIVLIAGRQGEVIDRATETLISSVTDLNYLSQYLEIYTPTVEEMALFKEKTSSVKDWLKTEIDPVLVDNFLEAVSQSEKKMGY